jgi:hypothetical protein
VLPGGRFGIAYNFGPVQGDGGKGLLGAADGLVGIVSRRFNRVDDWCNRAGQRKVKGINCLDASERMAETSQTIRLE